MAQVILYPGWTVFDANGNPAAGAKARFYTAGTSTQVNVYSNSTLTTPHAVPVVADAQGRFPTIYAASGLYKIKVTDSLDVDLFPEVDNWTILTDLTQTQLSFATVTKTADYAVVAGDRGKVIEVDASGGTVIITLNAATLGNGFPVWIVNSGATGTVQLQFGGGETLLGAATYNLTNQYQSVGIVSRGAAGWDLIAAYGFNFDTLATFNQGFTVAAGKPATHNGPLIKKYTTLTDAGTIAWDMATGANFKVTITANRIFGAPTNLVEGQFGELMVIQNATGGWVPTWTAPLTFDGGSPNPKTAANSRTLYHYEVENGLVIIKRPGDLGPTVIKKAADQSVASTTLANDTDFTFPLAANTKYVVEMHLDATHTGTEDFKFDVTGPASPTSVSINAYFTENSSSINTNSNVGEPVDAFSATILLHPSTSAVLVNSIFIKAFINNGVNAGTFQFRWANGTTATSKMVKARSWMSYQVVN